MRWASARSWRGAGDGSEPSRHLLVRQKQAGDNTSETKVRCRAYWPGILSDLDRVFPGTCRAGSVQVQTATDAADREVSGVVGHETVDLLRPLCILDKCVLCRAPCSNSRASLPIVNGALACASTAASLFDDQLFRTLEAEKFPAIEPTRWPALGGEARAANSRCNGGHGVLRLQF